MNKYELTIVLDGKATVARKKKVAETVEKLVAISKGKLGKMEDWGEKELAYKIGKSTSGMFLHFPLEIEAGDIKNISTKLYQETDIIRQLIVRSES